MSRRTRLETAVERRAGQRCEYCGMHQSLQGATFHVEHIVPRTHGGQTVAENLAWSCPRCNLCKSDRLVAIDPETGQETRLFNPRADRWADHFRWIGEHLEPLTAVGRTTAALLDLNHSRRIRIRQAERRFGLFPPQTS